MQYFIDTLGRKTSMKKYLLLIVVLGCLVKIGFAQDSDEKAVAATVELLRKAMIDGDQKSLESLAAGELTYGHSSGLVEDKAAFVQAIVTGKNDFKSITISDQTIKMVGKDLAFVRHNLKGEIKLLDGSTNTPDIGVLQVWQKKKSQWKLLARQAFKH